MTTLLLTLLYIVTAVVLFVVVSNVAVKTLQFLSNRKINKMKRMANNVLKYAEYLNNKTFSVNIFRLNFEDELVLDTAYLIKDTPENRKKVTNAYKKNEEPIFNVSDIIKRDNFEVINSEDNYDFNMYDYTIQ